MKKIKWGVIGCGGIADRRTIPGMMLANNVELVSVMDANLDVANAVKEKYNAQYAFDNYEAILAQDEIEAVYIASPVFFHKEQAIAAAKAAEEARIAAEQAKEAAKKAEVDAAFKAATAPAPITGNTVNAPLPGRVLEINVKVGDEVKRGQTVVILDAMKMENNITSDYAGKVKQILVAVGEAVGDNAPMVEIE
jgi:biotin carboxyl carrier protein